MDQPCPQPTLHDRLHHPGHNWETYNFPNAFFDPNLVCCFQLNQLEKPEAGGHVVADRAATLDAWIEKHLMPTGSHSIGEMPMRSLWVADIKAPPPPAHPDERPRLVPAAIDPEPEDLTDPFSRWGGPAVRRSSRHHRRITQSTSSTLARHPRQRTRPGRSLSRRESGRGRDRGRG